MIGENFILRKLSLKTARKQEIRFLCRYVGIAVALLLFLLPIRATVVFNRYISIHELTKLVERYNWDVHGAKTIMRFEGSDEGSARVYGGCGPILHSDYIEEYTSYTNIHLNEVVSRNLSEATTEEGKAYWQRRMDAGNSVGFYYGSIQTHTRLYMILLGIIDPKIHYVMPIPSAEFLSIFIRDARLFAACEGPPFSTLSDTTGSMSNFV